MNLEELAVRLVRIAAFVAAFVFWIIAATQPGKQSGLDDAGWLCLLAAFVLTMVLD